jgi:hypothetical protein
MNTASRHAQINSARDNFVSLDVRGSMPYGGCYHLPKSLNLDSSTEPTMKAYIAFWKKQPGIAAANTVTAIAMLGLLFWYLRSVNFQVWGG